MISISSFKALPEIPNLAVKHGLNLEFTGLVDPLIYSEDFINITKQLKHINLYTSAHGPFYDLIPGSSDQEVSNLAKTKFIRAIDACKKLGIKNIVLHSGWIPTFYEDSVWITNSIAFWKSLLDNLDETFTIYLENVLEIKPYLIKDIIDGVNKKNFKACLDIGHVNACAKEDVLNWIELLGNRIGHVHLHNNFGVKDEHNGLNCGNLDIKTITSYLKINCVSANWNLEIRTNLEESIELIEKYK